MPAGDDGPSHLVVFAGGGTGGHLQPALALAHALRSIRPDVHPFFIGAERGIEARVLPERGLDHLLLRVRGLRRGQALANVGVLTDLGSAVARVVARYRRRRPALVVVTGGYAAAPAGLAAVLLRVPLALQEQNAYPGVTTRLLGRFARRLFLAYEGAADRIPGVRPNRVVAVGNPVRQPAGKDPRAARAQFGLPSHGRVVLVTGGSQGSRALNAVLVDLVRLLATEGRVADGLTLLWAAGPQHGSDVRGAIEALGAPSWVRVLDYIEDMPSALAAADIAVARSGAMTTAEFLSQGLPAVLVPLPTSAEDHQTWNARALEAEGAAIHLPQAELTAAGLLDTLLEILGDDARLRSMAASAKRLADPDAAMKTARHLSALLPPPSRNGDEAGSRP